MHACHTKRHDHIIPHLLTRQKDHVFATFPIGMATLKPRRPQTDGCGRLRTVANGCRRLGTLADTCGRLRTPEAGSREHGSTTRPPKSKTRTLHYAFGKQLNWLTKIVLVVLHWKLFLYCRVHLVPREQCPMVVMPGSGQPMPEDLPENPQNVMSNSYLFDISLLAFWGEVVPTKRLVGTASCY